MRALVFAEGRDAPPRTYDSRPLAGGDFGSEKWLQRIVYEHPELLPIEEIDPGAGAVAPLCRELSLPRPQGPVYLDMLGVTRRGRLVLVECKLWANPQARREVIGQILEYAALLKSLSYGDLSAKVAQRTGARSANPLYDLAAERLGLTDESAFVDAVSASLKRGEFDLLLVGDGIRSEIEAVRGYLEAVMGLRARLALVEIKSLWGADGELVLVPQLALRTQLLQHRVAEFGTISEERAASPSELELQAEPGSNRSPAAGENRGFWQTFIDEVRFAHPDQPRPAYAGNNWVRLTMPPPFAHVAAYRSVGGSRHGRLGVFTKLKGAAGAAVFAGLQQDRAEVEALFDQPVTLSWDDAADAGLVEVTRYMEERLSEAEQLAWLKRAADAFVSLLRPRLREADAPAAA